MDSQNDQEPTQPQPQPQPLPQPLPLQLPDAIWRYILTFFNPRDLCRMSLVNKEFYSWANDDALWKMHCLSRWQGKQSIQHMLRRHPENIHRNHSHPRSLTWKQWFAWAEYDKTRQVISHEELCDYAWKLFYNGRESTMGLRKFLPNGTYHSPYAGLCEWALIDNRLCFMGLQLPVTRNSQNWGWIIGQGTATIYHSIQDTHTNGQDSIPDLVQSIFLLIA